VNWQAIGARAVQWTIEFTVLLCWTILKTTAKLTAKAAPRAESRLAASRNGFLAGLAWVVGFGLLATVTLNPSVIVAGLLVGAIFGGVAGYATLSRGLADAEAAGGAIELGHRSGVMGAPTAHTIPRASRVRHLAVFGPTGSGKSTVMKNIVLQDAAAPMRPGLLCIDIKDDFALSLMDYLPAERAGDILLFDPSDTEHPPAFNPLGDIAPDERTLATAELLGALKRLCGESWGPRLEHVLRHILLTLVETPDATMLDIGRLLTDAAYRDWAVGHVTNFSVRTFWQREFQSIVGTKGSLANVESLLNKLSVFSYPEVRNVVGQTNRGLDLSHAMDRGQIVLAHLPQGILGEDIAHFFAALLVGKVQLAAQRRARLAHGARKTFYVFADEFQNYDTSAFTKLITEGRSMAVGLVCACQFREQLPAELRLAVEKNCAYALQCRYQAGRHVIEVIRLQEPNAPDASTLLHALPPPTPTQQQQSVVVRERSRAALSRPRAVVEAAIAARMQPGESGPSVRVAVQQRVVTTVVMEETEPPAAAGEAPPPLAQPPANGTQPRTRFEPL
jgi:hypothetical protein